MSVVFKMKGQMGVVLENLRKKTNILSVPCPMRRSDRLVGLQNQSDYREGQLVMWKVELIMVAMMTMMKAAMFMVNVMVRVVIVVMVMVVTVKVVVVDDVGDGDSDGADGDGDGVDDDGIDGDGDGSDGDGVDGDGIDGDSDGVPARSSPIISLRNHSNDLDKTNISFVFWHLSSNRNSDHQQHRWNAFVW